MWQFLTSKRSCIQTDEGPGSYMLRSISRRPVNDASCYGQAVAALPDSLHSPLLLLIGSLALPCMGQQLIVSAYD